MIFMNSDGYIDQNAEDGRKLTVAKFHDLILEKAEGDMAKIGEHLDVAFDVYRGIQNQRDDATVLGIRF
jgi:serine phosphatase RsbU (regulator of sigma subunit)